MFALLALAIREHAEDPCDILGDVYHELRLNNEWNGQFFTPDHICRLMAQLTNIDVPEDKEGPITINEPNLWNNYVEEGREKSFTPEDLFCCEFAPYFMEGIKVRYPEYCRDLSTPKQRIDNVR